MNTNFKTQINKIRKEAIDVGFSKVTIDGYLSIWNRYIIWKQVNDFLYDEKDYSKFLLECYGFDVNTFSNKSTKSWFQQLMRSKRILDDFNSYKKCITREALPRELYNIYPSEWEIIFNNYEKYCLNVRQNSQNTIKAKTLYARKISSWFYQNKVIDLSNITKEHIFLFTNIFIDKSYKVKERYFYVLKQFLEYLFIDDILNQDLSIYVPSIKKESRRKIPTYLKVEDIQTLLDSININTVLGKRDYCIILLASRYGLRISDILNIKLKDIDWINNKINVKQLKNNNLNLLPLTKEIGWAIINYIKESRPKCKNEYLFVKMKYPFDKMTEFSQFNKYFDKADIKTTEKNKKGIHNLRHSLASNMLDSGIPLNIISSTLGDTLETTSNTYIRTSEKLLSQCVLEVDE